MSMTTYIEAPKRRGRPKGSKNRSTTVRRAAVRRTNASRATSPMMRTPLSPAEIAVQRIQELQSENVELRARALQMESDWKVIEDTLFGKSAAPRRRRTGPSAPVEEPEGEPSED